MSPLVSPVGAPELMPPASQGVEQRSECHAGRTGSRWVLRAFVIGGLAGAAWLLSGAAAQAADHTSVGPAIGGPSTLSPVHRALPETGDKFAISPFAISPLVNGLGNEAVERTVDEDARTTGDTTLGGLVRELTAPLRPAGEPVVSTKLAPVTGIVARVIAPLVQTLRPATVLPHHAAAAAPVAPRPATVAALDGHTSITGPARSAGVSAAVKLPAVDPTGRITADSGPPTMGGSTTVTQRRFAVADRHTAATTARPDGVRNTPGSPEPAPLRVHLGAVSGIPTSGSGAPPEGGCAATLAAAVAGSMVACHRPPIATDVEVRRYDAESPTVSPD